VIGFGSASGSLPWQVKLRRLLARGRGARLGEATVISRLVHMRDHAQPHMMMLMMGADAGQTFYGRANRGEVIHLDICHAIADVDHRRVAARLLDAVGGVVGEEGRPLLDWFDLQTATGGGRVTGDLNWGRKESLRIAHRNHVHLAGLLPDEQLSLLLPLVCAVEEAILAEGVELRKVERLSHVRSDGGRSLDLSPYQDVNDSLVRESGAASRRNGGGGSLGTSTLDRLRRPEDRGEIPPTENPPSSSGQGAPAAETTGDPWSELAAEEAMSRLLDLVKRVGSPEELREILRQLDRDGGWNSMQQASGTQAIYTLRDLEEAGYLTREVRGLQLTASGKELLALLERHLRQVKLRFRKMIRRVPTGGRKGARPGVATDEAAADVRYGPVRGVAPAEPGSWLGEIAVPETVRRAVVRARLSALPAGSIPATSPLRLSRSEIWVQKRASEKPLHICLLVDASASMAGRRILAAKHLVRHLLASTRDKVAVIAFQEREVKVFVPFTRDWAEVEVGLARIQPMGLTPLADGLIESLDLIQRSRVRRPLLLLITDGIPTVSKWSIDPLADGLRAARSVGSARVPFGCIGLQPSRRYLTDLVQTAGGTLHVVDELDESALVSIAHQERRKLARRLRQGKACPKAKQSGFDL
jgi:magnesium chelatase subunit D